MLEYELEALPELEGELEWEDEGEEFLGRIAGLAGRALRSPALRRAGLSAARAALRGGLGAIGAPPAVGAALGRLLPQREDEGELEWEYEAEMNPLRRVYPDVLMEHLGHAAAEAESEAEAEAFIGALIPLAARLLPRVAPAIMRAAPGLIRGAARAARVLRSSPSTRPLVRALPTVVRRTAAAIGQQAASGRPVTPRAAVRTLARQTASVVGNPQQCARAMQRSQALDRRYHRGAGAARPGVAR